jgi:hypothetical protein
MKKEFRNVSCLTNDEEIMFKLVNQSLVLSLNTFVVVSIYQYCCLSHSKGVINQRILIYVCISTAHVLQFIASIWN